MALEVKLEKEDKALLLISSIPSSYEHLAITIMYGKETLELENVRQMLQNNKLMKKNKFHRRGIRADCRGPEEKIKK